MHVSFRTFSPKLQKEIPADYIFSHFQFSLMPFPQSLYHLSFLYEAFLKGGVEKYKERKKTQRKQTE